MGKSKAFLETVADKAQKDTLPKEQTRHDDVPNTIMGLAKYLGIDYGEAHRFFDHIRHFTGSGFAAIREAQRDPEYAKNHPGAKLAADALEEFLRLAPKWNGGTTYRGFPLDANKVKSLKVGQKVNVNNEGTASWTTEIETSKVFADSPHDASKKSVIFICETQSKGTSIKNISHLPFESEVMVSKDAEYTITKIDKKSSSKYTFVYVKEA